MCLETGLPGRQAGCEVVMKLRRVKIIETVCCLFYRSRLAEVTWNALSAVSPTLSESTPPSTRRAAPLVAEASGLQTKVTNQF